MSSGRRPNGSVSPSAWRSISASKRTAPASVTLVFAEPEQGAPLQSAAAKLPPAAYTNDHMLRKRDRLDSTSTVRDDQKDSVSTGEGSMKRNRAQSDASQIITPEHSVQSNQVTSAQNTVQSASNAHHIGQWEGLVDVTSQSSESPNTASSITLTPTESLSVPFPSRESTQSISTPKFYSNGSSWFGSLSRAKGKGKAATALDESATYFVASEAQTSLADTEVCHPSPHDMLHASDRESELLIPGSPYPLEQKSQLQTTRGWFYSSPTTSASTARPPLSPTSPHSHSHSNSGTSIPSSLDEEVPRLTVITPPNTPHPPSVMQNSIASNLNLSSLNPSNRRFTLSIPLLGRPKMPLDKAVAVASDNRSGSEGVTGQVMRAAEGSPTITMPNTTIITAGDDELSSPEEHSRDTLKAEGGQMRETTPASWWGYVGWSTSHGNDITTEAQLDNPTLTPSLASESLPVRAIKSDPQPTVSTNVPELQSTAQRPREDETGTPKDIMSGNPKKQSISSPKDKAPSVFSAGTTQSQGSTAWYVPWTWYPDSSTNIIVGSVAQDRNAKTTMTQSEIIKEQALARDRGPQTSIATIEATSPGPTVSQAQEQSNPIESSIFSNASGWASFFSSKSLVIKKIADVDKAIDENGMEVMDIDDEEGRLHPKATPSVAAGTTRDGKAKDQGRQGADALSHKPKSPEFKLPEPKVAGQARPPALLPTTSDSMKRETAKTTKRKASPAPSTTSVSKSPGSPRNPNLVLPTWKDTFHTPPRSLVASAPSSTISKTLNFVSGVLFQRAKDGRRKGKGQAEGKEFAHFGQGLPKAFDIVPEQLKPDVLRGCKKAVIIGIHGWFPGAVMRTVLGDPTGTSGKFVDMMLQALDEFQEKHKVKIKKITKIPLEGEGTINKRVDKLYKNLQSNRDWMDDLHTADVIFIATHSQGSIVSAHLLDRLIRDGHVKTFRSISAGGSSQSLASGSADIVPKVQPQRICCLALCGIHLGPLRYLSTSSLLQPYFQYFESAAARELFEFQDTESEVSKHYVAALTNIMHHGAKMVYVASLNDQVVPMYSGLFTTASHPLILRALYIDGDAYQSSDFLSNLLVLLLRVMNSGISDSGLLGHLSEATAGSLSGVGHSTAYEELATYSLAVDYCFLTNDGSEAHPELIVDSFNAKSEQNDYEIPWSLRDMIADEQVAHFFAHEIVELRDAFRDWHPKTAILRDIKRKLQPIQRLPSSIIQGSSGSVSKL